MRIDDPEWALVRLASAEVGCKPEEFVALAIVNLADMVLVGDERSRKVLVDAVRQLLNEPDRFAHLRKKEPAPPPVKKRRRAVRPPQKSGRPAAGRTSLKHNPFADLLKDKK